MAELIDRELILSVKNHFKSIEGWRGSLQGNQGVLTLDSRESDRMLAFLLKNYIYLAIGKRACTLEQDLGLSAHFLTRREIKHT